MTFLTQNVPSDIFQKHFSSFENIIVFGGIPSDKCS